MSMMRSCSIRGCVITLLCVALAEFVWAEETARTEQRVVMTDAEIEEIINRTMFREKWWQAAYGEELDTSS